MKKNLDEKEMRAFVKEVIKTSLDLKELDVLLPRINSQWKDEAASLRTMMVDLMKNIENDDFADGVKKIEGAVKLLGTWKAKIEKLL